MFEINGKATAKCINVFYKIILIMSLFFCDKVVAQQVKVSGYIRSEKKQPLAFSNIICYDYQTKDSLVVAFTSSEETGFYTLEFLSSPKLKVWVTCMGFEPETFQLAIQDSLHLTFTQDFILKEQSKLLDSIVVVGQRIPVSVKEDTISYQVKAFKTGLERNVEELLKRLPNVSISENGDISVNGKSVEKILIEGEELFSENYKVISRNMGSNSIEKVEVIDNYNDNPLLKSYKKSGATVLNLKLDEQAKNQLFGNITIQKANRNLGEMATNIFSVAKKLKFGLIGNTNTIGFDPLPDAEYYMEKYHQKHEDDFIQTNLEGIQPFINFNFQKNAFIPAEKYLSNRALLIGGSTVYNINKRLKIKGLAYINQDRQTYTNVQKYRYFMNDKEDIVFTDSSTLTQRPRIFSSQLQIDYQINQKTFLRFFATIGQHKNQLNQQLSIQSSIYPDSFQTKSLSNYRINNYSLSFTRKISDKTMIDLLAIYGTYFNPQSLYSSSRRYGLLDSTMSNKAFEQAVYQKNESLEITAKMYFKMPKLMVVSSFDVQIGNETANLSNNFNAEKGKQSLEKRSVLFASEWTYTLNKLQLIGGAKGLFFRMFNTSNFSSGVAFNPMVGIGYRASIEQKMMAIYSRMLTLPTLNTITDNTYFNDYRTLQRGADTLKYGIADVVALRYELNQPQRLFSFYFSLSKTVRQQSYIDKIDIDNIFTKQIKKFYALPLNSWDVDFGVTKMLGLSGVQINTKGYYLRAESAILLDNNLSKNTNQSVQLEEGISTSFKGKINGGVGYKLRLYQRSLADTPNEKYHYFLQNAYSSLRMKISNSISLSANYEYFKWQNQTTDMSANFIDFLFVYRPVKSKISIECSGFNLLNFQTNFSEQITNLYTMQETLYIRPRTMLAKITLSI